MAFIVFVTWIAGLFSLESGRKDVGRVRYSTVGARPESGVLNFALQFASVTIKVRT